MTALPAPSVALDDQLCFALYAASRAMTARYRPMLDVLGLTYPQYLVMMLLWESDHQTVGQLGSRLALDSGTLSPLLKRLTAAGLVTRHRRVEDERSVSIALTEEGRVLRDKAFAISEEMIGAIGFKTDEFHDLMERLRLLTERVNGGAAVCWQRLPATGQGRATVHDPYEASSIGVLPVPRSTHAHSHCSHRLERHAAGGFRPGGAQQLQGRDVRRQLPQAGC